MEKLIINAAVTGMVPTKDDTPHVPITVEEIVADVKRCRDAGASIVHVHPRDAAGRPSCEPEAHAAIFRGIRAAVPDMIISATTSGREHREFEQRSAGLGAEPDMGSLTLGSMNFPRSASINAPEMIQRLAGEMNRRGVVPEMEFFELGMIDYARDFLVAKGVLKPPFYANLLLGSLGTLAATPENLVAMVRALPAGTTWAATGIGRFQFFINALAITMGGNVRVGLEDSIYFDPGKQHLATNAGLIDRVVGVARSIGREIATPAETRRIIGLPVQREAEAVVG
ncbi:MAG: beta-keto acid cleavage family enzyme [Planctomycetota bacterium]